LDDMTALAQTGPSKPRPRREKAARTVEAALRRGLIFGAVAAVGWLLAAAISASAIFLLVIVTVLAAVYTVARGDKARLGVWALVAVGWAAVILERAIVNAHGGLWVALACWLGIVSGARAAGISKRWLVALAYPVALGAIVLAAGQSLTNPWGVSWLWVAAILGPVIGLRTLLNPSPRDHAANT
jgi:hypothetical protein